MGYVYTDSSTQLQGFFGRNWFVSHLSHAAYAAKVDALKAYRGHAATLRGGVQALAQHGVAAPQVIAAAHAVHAYEQLVAQGEELIDAAAALVASEGVPSTPPPEGVTLASWRESWWIDLDAVDALLPELEDASNAASAAVDQAAEAVQNARRARGEQVPPAPTLPQGPPIDWHGPGDLFEMIARLLRRPGAAQGRGGTMGSAERISDNLATIAIIGAVLWVLSRVLR